MPTTTNKIGLALSGGGFRATLYHLGLVRFLRDAGILPRVTHITSVSGGSILAAHLVMNWDRYTGSAGEFESAASEILAFVRLDVRNRVMRRFPLAFPLRWPRRLLGYSNRLLTRVGWLEYYYTKYLYGDCSLFQLPERPQLHILATNLSEGCLCSFNRNGLLMMRRRPGQRLRMDQINAGLATVPMAVTASSAFPGFFPPLELTAADIGAAGGEFGRQSYTDGGVFDNLGVRMFGLLQRRLLMDSPLSRDDFLNFGETAKAFREADHSNQEIPLCRFTRFLVDPSNRPVPLFQDSAGSSIPALPPPGSPDAEDAVMAKLWNVLRSYPLHQEPVFARLKLASPDADALFLASREGEQDLDAGDQYWLNRHLLDAAFREATGRPCFRRLNGALDGVLVSDVGKRIQVRAGQRAGGLLRTSMRSTEIVMDRVWQLENETFNGMPGFVFAPMTDVVRPAEDPTALHPEIQRQAAGIRTDMDRFSWLEISSLVQHGYCVARKVCRSEPEVFGHDLPADAPWDPVAQHAARKVTGPPSGAQHSVARSRETISATVDARKLQASAFRRIWSSLLDPRDWVSYVYVPILVPIFFLLPLVAARYFRHTHRINQITESLSQGTRDLEQMSRLLDGQVTPWKGAPPEEVRGFDEPDLSGFEILQDMRILDLRAWDPTAKVSSEPDSVIYGYRRLKVFKKPDHAGSNQFRMQLLATSPQAQVRFPPQQVQGQARMARLESSNAGRNDCQWEAAFDFEKVPAGEFVDLIVEYLSPGQFLKRGEDSTTLTFEIQGETSEVTRWLLLPQSREYRSFQVVRYETGKPETAESAKIVTEYLAKDFTILAYKLLAVPAGYTYEVTWYYK